jgi:hypothetical protein
MSDARLVYLAAVLVTPLLDALALRLQTLDLLHLQLHLHVKTNR